MSDKENSEFPIKSLVVFGSYNDSDLYQRNRVLVDQLEALSKETLRIRPASSAQGHSFSSGQTLLQRGQRWLSDACALARQHRSLKHAEVVFVPYPAWLDVLLLCLLPKRGRRLLIVDAFLELKSTVVDDRRLLASGSFGESALLAFQRFTLSRADVVLIDTEAQAELLRERLRGTSPRVVSVPVGIDEDLWQPLPPPQSQTRCRVLFWGTFIPLHGMEHILGAARQLESDAAPVDFLIVGDGQVADAFAAALEREALSNLSWERTLLSTEELRSRIEDASIVLGVFGDSAKAGAVLPYKLHQALASNRPVITRSGPAIDAIADSSRGLYTCSASDPGALAQEILEVYKRVQEGPPVTTRAIYDQHLSQHVIRAVLRDEIQSS